MKKWEDLTISNDFLFSKVMRDAEICKEVLEVLLDIEIDKIEYIQEQKTIDLLYEQKSIRMDIFVKAAETLYNVEMQTTNQKDLTKRIRYYMAMGDLYEIDKGDFYQILERRPPLL